MTRKSGNRENKKNTSYGRLSYLPSSKRSYIRRATSKILQSESTINKDVMIPDIDNSVYRFNQNGIVRSNGAVRTMKLRDVEKLKNLF